MSDDLIADLQRQVRELQTRLDELEHGPEQDFHSISPPLERGEGAQLSRRGLFAKAGIVAAGVGGAGLLSALTAEPASAETGAMMFGATNYSGPLQTWLTSTASETTLRLQNEGSGYALDAWSTNGASSAVSGTALGVSASGSGVLGYNDNNNGSGVKGVCDRATNNAAGVWGETAGVGSAVYGKNTNAASTAGVFGDALGTTAGVWGRNTQANAPGVKATVNSDAPGFQPAVGGFVSNALSAGVWGWIDNASNSSAAVRGDTSGVGSGVYGANDNPKSTAGVFGDSVGKTAALFGRNAGNSTQGVGVHAESESGRGGTFEGKAAAVRLLPSIATAHPDTGQRGDLFVTKSGQLWFCKGGTSWTQLA